MAERQERRSGTTRRALKWSLAAVALSLELAILGPWLARADLGPGDVHWQWVGFAIGVEAVSVVALGALYRPLLRAGGLPMSRGRSAALGAAASAITATVPGGPAVASGYLYRQFRRIGGSPALSGWSVAVAGALSIAGFGVVASTAAAMQSADSLSAAARAAGIGLAIAALLILAAIVLLHNAKPFLRLLQ